MKRSLLRLGILTVVAGAWAAPAALAGLTGTVTSKLEGIRGHAIRISGAGQENINVRVGTATFSKLSATGDGEYLASSYDGYCVDLEDSISTGSTHTWTVTEPATLPGVPDGDYGPMSALQADRLARLWSNYYSEIGSSKDKSSAFQLAVWEIVYQRGADKNGPADSGDYDVTNGYVAATLGGVSEGFQAHNAKASVVDFANTWLRSLDSKSASVDLMGLTSTTQDFITTFAIPSPTASALGLVGVGFVAMRRRFLA